MTTTSLVERRDRARQVADAVMYEGYVLFPYRAATTKNRYRWQWGVVVPAAQVDLGASEPAEVRCQVLLRAPRSSCLSVTARFLHLRHRQVEDPRGQPVDQLEVGGELHVTWDEGEEHEVTHRVSVGDLTGDRRDVAFTLDPDESVEELGGGARLRRSVAPVAGELEVGASELDAGVVRLDAAVRNVTGWSRRRAHRDEILRRSLVGVHLILELEDGSFASAIDPPAWAEPFAGTCRSRHVHPVLVGDAAAGDDDVVLAAPIILYDHPTVAPESTGPSFDATEIDELLALAVLGLTEDEKRAARATDPRAAELIDRTEALPPAVMQRLHGTIRDRAEIRAGSRVRLRPTRRADAHDLFLAGRVAVVERFVETDDGRTYAAVTLEDDPGADLHRWYGRFLYFEIGELDPVRGD